MLKNIPCKTYLLTQKCHLQLNAATEENRSLQYIDRHTRKRQIVVCFRKKNLVTRLGK